MSDNELIRFIKDRFTEMEKERTALISDIKELAKESGKNLATANERVGALNVALSNIKGKTRFEWCVMVFEYIFLVLVVFAVVVGMLRNYTTIKIGDINIQKTISDQQQIR